MTALASSTLASELAAYIGTAIQAARYLRQPEPTDNELRLVLVKDGFTAAEIELEFAAAKQIAAG